MSSLMNENVYTIGFIDAATKRAWLYQRKKKSDILDCVKDYYESVVAKRLASHKLKDFVIQSDNGSVDRTRQSSSYKALEGSLGPAAAPTHLKSWLSLNACGGSLTQWHRLC